MCFSLFLNLHLSYDFTLYCSFSSNPWMLKTGGLSTGESLIHVSIKVLPSETAIYFVFKTFGCSKFGNSSFSILNDYALVNGIIS